MKAQHPGDFLHRFQTAAHGPPSPVVKKGSRPSHGAVLPKVSEGLFQFPRSGRLQLAGQQGVELLPGSSPYPTAAPQQRPAGVLQLLRSGLTCRSQTSGLGPPHLVHRLVQVHRDMEPVQHMQGLAGLRRDHAVFRRRRFFRGRDPDGTTGDIIWLTPAGEMMTDADWAAGYAKSLAVFLNGDAISEPDPRGGKIADDKFLLLFNAHSKPLTFTLPEASYAAGWEVVIDTAFGMPGAILPPKKEIEVCDRAVVVLRSTE